MNGKKGMNAAAFYAALRGDLPNALIASTEGGIEAQEARGQRDFVEAETLPKDGLDDAICEALGISVIGDYDDLFYRVSLPVGWSKRATDHSMHSELLDDKGRKRAGIFYKAAFYDRAAHIGFVSRYKATKAPINGWAGYDHNGGQFVAIVEDCGVEIWRSAPIEHRSEGYFNLADLAVTKLDEMFPDWRNVLAYWDSAELDTTDVSK
jgi:hypothetical protein